MIFDELMAEQKRVVQAFLDNPTHPLMILRTEPDLELVVARMLALWGEDDEDTGGETIAFGISAPFVDAEQFCSVAEGQLSETIDELVAAFAEQGEELLLPRGMARGRACPQARVEVLFAELLEGLARGLAGWHNRTLIAIRFDEIAKVDACVEMLARISQAIASPNLKLVVLDSRPTPRLPPLELQRDRLIIDSFEPRVRDMGGALQKVIEHDRRRVVALRVRNDDIEPLWHLLWDLRKRQGLALRPFYVEAEFHTRLQFGNHIYQRLISGQAPPPRWAGEGMIVSDVIPELKQAPITDLPPDLYDQRSMQLPEATFTETVERALERLGDVYVCIVVRPHRTGSVEEWQSFVRQLSAQAVSARVTWIVIDVDGSAPLPPAQVDRFAWIEHEFTMGAPELETGLEKSLKLPDLPAPMRIQSLLMLGGLWAGKGRVDEGIQLLAEGVDLSESEGSPEQRGAAWWLIGNALQRAGSIAPARNAYVEATNISLDSGNDMATANALMSLGHTYFLDGEYGQALQTYEVARTYWQKVGQTFGACNASIWMAEAYRQGQHPAEAEQILLSVYATYRAMQEPFVDMAKQGMAEVHERLAMLYRQVGRLDEAAIHHHNARELGCMGVSEQPA